MHRGEVDGALLGHGSRRARQWVAQEWKPQSAATTCISMVDAEIWIAVSAAAALLVILLLCCGGGGADSYEALPGSDDHGKGKSSKSKSASKSESKKSSKDKKSKKGSKH
eukprot:COSAG05_NODE_80_length_21046_cov_45.708325_10_plen_110_part_00